LLIAAFLASPAAAQNNERKSLEVFSSNDCRITLGTFTVPVGQTATQFLFSFNTSWQACQGVDHMDWITFGIRGALGGTVYECTEFFDKRPARETPGPVSGIVTGPGTYTVYLLSGRNSSVRMTYALAGGGIVPAGAVQAAPVTVYRDSGCTLYPGNFRVGPGCTASGFRFSLNTSWQPCSGAVRVDEVTFVIRGPGGVVYEYLAHFDGSPPLERLGGIAGLTLGPGSYTLFLGSGRDSTVTLNYAVSCGAPPAAPGYEQAELLAAIETDFKYWYIKTAGTGDASVYRLGSDAQGKRSFTWSAISKEVISNNDIMIPRPGRIYMDAEFRMEDRPEYQLQHLYAVGTPYTQIWKNNAWQNYPEPFIGGWRNYVGYAGTRPILPSEGFKYSGTLGGPIRVLGSGLAVQAGKFRVAVLSAIATDWLVHYPSRGKIYVYFIADR
jgi:hypothetical protein